MGNRRLSRALWAVFAGVMAAAVVAAPAPAGKDDLDIFAHFSSVADGTGIGVGGDGSEVFYSSHFTIAPAEEFLTLDDVIENPSLRQNPDLFRWTPDINGVAQFTATGDITTADGTGVEVFTFNDKPSVETKTFRLYDPETGDRRNERVVAVAFRSNADQALPGPYSSIEDVDPRVAFLQGGTVYVWDSEGETFTSVFEFMLTPMGVTLDAPSLAMKTRRTFGRAPFRGTVPTAVEIKDILVAFSGDADPAADNFDGNNEIFLWSRRAFSADGTTGGIGVNNGGVQQVTHTIDGDCWAPAVNHRGEIAFLSTSDITGGNADGSVELFLWKKGRFRQLTSITSGTIGAPRWSANGRTLVFDAAADLVRANPDESSEVFVRTGRRIRQITHGTTGGSTAPAVDSTGRTIAFVTDADLDGVVYSSPAAEVILTTRSGKSMRQETYTTDGGVNEGPSLTTKNGETTMTWISSSNFDGRNSNNLRRIYRRLVRSRTP